VCFCEVETGVAMLAIRLFGIRNFVVIVCSELDERAALKGAVVWTPLPLTLPSVFGMDRARL
jgi:hypothetical protein